MADYQVILTPAARRQLDRTSGATLTALRGVILGLATDPRPPGATKELIGGSGAAEVQSCMQLAGAGGRRDA